MSLATRSPDASIGTNAFIATLYSKQVVDTMQMELVCVNAVDHTWAKQLAYGNILTIPIINTVSAHEVTVGSAGGTTDPYNTAAKTITIDKWYECPVVIDSMSTLQTHVDVWGEASKETSEAVKVVMDTSVNALFSALSSSSVYGADGQTFTDDILIDLHETLDESDVPMSDRKLIGDPSTKADIFRIDKFIRNDYIKGSPIASGQVGELYGAPVLVTNNLTGASTGAYGVLIHTKAIGVIIQENMKSIRVEEPLKHIETVLSEALWGLAEIRDSFGKSFYTRKA